MVQIVVCEQQEASPINLYKDSFRQENFMAYCDKFECPTYASFSGDKRKMLDFDETN